MNPPTSPPPTGASRIGAVVAIALVLLVYAGTTLTVDRGLSNPKPGGYYAFLTDAFLAGQTSLKIQPDPRLKLLSDPYLGAQGVPRLHDATFYHGKYYLYFGPAPVFFLFGPWRLLTGTFLTDGAGTAFFATAGFLFGCGLLWGLWRRWFAGLPAGWLAGAILVWGFGNYGLILMMATTVYPVPITCAYALLMAALFALWRAGEARNAARAGAWLAVGGFLWACTVAARPNYIFSLPALPWAALALAGAPDGRAPFARRRWLAVTLVATPVVLVGIALAAYNWVRFHNVFEFGVTYQLAGSDQRHLRVVDPGRIFGNFRLFLLGDLRCRFYFPFQAPGDGLFGLLTGAPIAFLGLLFPATPLSRRLRQDPRWWGIGGTLLAVFALNLAALGISFVNERYVLDFLPAAVLLALATGWTLAPAAQGPPPPPWGWRAAGGLAIALAVLTVVAGAIFSLSRYPDQRRLAPLARGVDRIAAGIEHLLGARYGPLEFRVTFSPQPGRSDPLVVTGRGRDVLFVTYLDADRIRLGFQHAGAVGPTSEPIPVTPGRSYRLDINLGSLYPPRDHPALAGWTDLQSEELHRVIDVRLDGQEVLRGAADFYPATPWDIAIGRNRGGLVTGPRFRGRLEPAGTRGIPPPAALPAHALSGPLRLTLTIPPFSVYRTEPLISTGHAGAGDLLFLTYLGPGRICFGHDSWNGGAITSPPLSYTPDKSSTLEVDMGSLRPIPGTDPVYAPLILRFNGQLLLRDRRPFFPTTPQEVTFGFNGDRSTSSSDVFSGHIQKIEPIPAVPLPPEIYSAIGPIHLLVRFPNAVPGASEPLVVTGRTGAGDLIYVTYDDPTHIRIGYDHWLVGGPRGHPVSVDYAVPHDVEVALGSLLPPPSDPWWGATPPAARLAWRRLVRVTVDGVIALDAVSDAYPAARDQVYVGTNPIGGSTCQPDFTGEIFVAKRRGPEALPAGGPAPAAVR